MKPVPNKDLTAAVEEGLVELEEMGGFCYVDAEQFIRDARKLIEIAQEEHDQ